VLYFLRDWLDKHILFTDHEYKEALKKISIV
jgi:hemerythrin